MPAKIVLLAALSTAGLAACNGTGAIDNDFERAAAGGAGGAVAGEVISGDPLTGAAIGAAGGALADDF